ncbi:hypothetical protein V8E54_007747 [Elaphomyces granulatus]
MEKEAKHWWMNRLCRSIQTILTAESGMDRTDPNPGGSAGPGPEGRTTQVKAEIYKLMLHEEGAFLPHQDSEKADEIFGITNTPVQSSASLD